MSVYPFDLWDIPNSTANQECHETMNQWIKEVYKFCKTMPHVYKFSQLNKKFRENYHKIDLKVYLQKIPVEHGSKHQILQVLLNYYAYLPAQGSIAWKEAKEGDHERPPTIGGSEIGTILGTNPYQKTKDLIASKLKIGRPFEGNAATRWGNLFEEVASSLMEMRFGTATYETGSIPGLHHPNGRLMQTYSPDRLGVISRTKLNLDIDNEEFIQLYNSLLDEEWTILFEFKCPLKRIPSNHVPNQYKSQPQLGASTIPIIDACIFVDSMFRKCSIEDFGLNGEYDKVYHPDPDPSDTSKPKPKSKKDNDHDCDEIPEIPMLCGFIGIYATYPPFKEAPPKVITEAKVHKCQTLESESESESEISKTLITVDPILDPIEMPQSVIEDFGRILYKLVETDLSTPGSEFYGDSDFSNFMSQISLCDKFMNCLYQIPEFALYKITPHVEEQIVIYAISCMTDPQYHEIIRMLVPNALKVNYNLRNNPTCDVKDLTYGRDLGDMQWRQFDDLLKIIINERFTNPGLRAYYPNGYYTGDNSNCAGFPDNYVDLGLPTEPERAQKWLATGVKKFIDFCEKSNYAIIGILPYKLFKQSVIPMVPDREFVSKVYDKLIEVTNLIDEIKKSAPTGIAPADKIKIYETVFNEKFPPTARALAMRAKKAQKESETSTGDYDVPIRDDEPIPTAAAYAQSGSFSWDDIT